MKLSPIYQLIKDIDNIPFNSPECGDYYNSLTKLFKRALENEAHEIAMAYSEGWHDGQDVIIDRIEHVNLGGDAAGVDFYNEKYKNPKP